MQSVKNYPEIKKYIKISLFSSFLITSIVNIIFIATSCYTYFVIKALTKTQNIASILTPTITIIILYAFCYAIIVKRDNLIIGLSRFIDFLSFNNIINVGVIINARTNSTITSKLLMKDIETIKQFILQKQIIGIFNLPWIFISIAIICYFSYTNAVICGLCLIICLLLTIFNGKYYKQFNTSQTKENYDFINDLFENSKSIRCNFNIENIIRNKALEDTQNYNENSIIGKKISFFNSLMMFFISFSQVLIFITSIILVLIKEFTFGEFILTIILSNKTLFSLNKSFTSLLGLSKIKKSFYRINDAIQKTNDISLSQKPKNNDKLSIELQEVSYLDFKTQKEIFTNINGELIGGEIYVVNCKNNDKNVSFLNLLSGNFLPSNGKIVNNKIENNDNKFLFYLPKEPFFIKGTILENISGFEEKPDIIRIKNIIKSLDFDGEIEKLKYGLDTILTSKKEYSEPFLKKINIASMIYQNANILILEEPFELLDNKSALYIVDLINTNKKLGKMIVLSTTNINNEYIDLLNSINIIDFQ